MRKVLIWMLVIVIAASAGIGAAAAIGWLRSLNPGSAFGFGWAGPGMMGGQGSIRPGTGPGGMMGGGRQGVAPGGAPLTLDQAVQTAQSYIAGYSTSLQVKEVMQFNQNFYAAVVESDTGRGAFELLIDPYNGTVFSEPGPNMMWNQKYGHMGSGQGGENSLSLEQARDLAQQALDKNLPGAQVEEDGFSFYGYYTFDYKANGQIDGMLSVNGYTGEIWPHTWHGQFIDEKEVSQ